MKKTFAYITYVIAVTMVFLYYLFPSDALETYMAHHVSRLWPAFQVKTGTITPSLPPGLKVDHPVLYRDQQAIADADWLKFVPAWLTLFSAEKEVRIRGGAYEGALTGRILLSGLDASPAVDLDLVFGGIQVDQIPSISAFITHTITGEAAGKLRFNNLESHSGNGKLEITVTDSSLSLNPPVLEIRELNFNSIDLEADLADGRVRISRFDVKGREANITASGTIVLREPLDASAVNISGKILPHPSFIRNLSGMVPSGLITERSISSGGIPFRISGTVVQPGFSLR